VAINTTLLKAIPPLFDLKHTTLATK